MRLLIDTSAWLAFLLQNEEAHVRINKFIVDARKTSAAFFTTNDIVDETVTRLIYDNNRRVAEKFVELLTLGMKNKSLSQLWTDEKIQLEAFGIIKKFKDHKLSLTDATTVAIMKRFKFDAVVTLDSDFHKIGIISLP